MLSTVVIANSGLHAKAEKWFDLLELDYLSNFVSKDVLKATYAKCKVFFFFFFLYFIELFVGWECSQPTTLGKLQFFLYGKLLHKAFRLDTIN